MSALSEVPSEIRGVLIPLQQQSLLLPNAAVAEIIDYRELESAQDFPEWVVGSTQWRQRNLPVVQFEKFLDQAVAGGGQRRKILVCHTLQADAQRPFVGILAMAIPRLVRVTQEQLQGEELGAELADAPVLAALKYDGERALIPDLAGLERCLAQA